jgi:AcrR family transcriptional regulator
MGHREALLEGAKRCLIEKGYARTTARDIVAASGTNLGSIGYHYGSKGALLNAALFQANAEWGEALDRALKDAPDGAAAPHERFEAFWTTVIGLFDEHRRLWALNMEAIAWLEDAPEIRRALEEARFSLGESLFAHLGEGRGSEKDPDDVRAVGNLYHALLIGVMAQWLIDPESAPSGPVLSRALRTLAAATSPVPAALENHTRDARSGGAGCTNTPGG